MPTRIVYVDKKRQDVVVRREGAIWVASAIYYGRALEARARSEARAVQRWYEAAILRRKEAGA